MKTSNILANFQFVDNKVIDFSIQNSLLKSKDIAIKVDFDMDYEIVSCRQTETSHIGIVDFIVEITGNAEGKGSYKVYLKMRGLFIGSKNNLSIDKFEKMLEVNGTATLSQISRAYIISVTSLSGMHTINLPMVNIYSMKKNKDNSKVEASH